MNRDSIESQISETAEEAKRLPPELRAMNEAMNMVFNAVTNAAPVEGPGRTGQAADGPPPVAASRRMDIETAILRAPGFDYLLASEIFAALQRRLELRYENLNPQVEEAMQRLSRAFEQAS